MEPLEKHKVLSNSKVPKNVVSKNSNNDNYRSVNLTLLTRDTKFNSFLVKNEYGQMNLLYFVNKHNTGSSKFGHHFRISKKFVDFLPNNIS